MFKVGNFEVGDRVKVVNFMGHTIRETEVVEITKSGNVRTKAYKGLFRADGTERRRNLNWTDSVMIFKL